MSILHLRTFVEVYRQSSLGRAAEVLGLTQPAVSNHIASLETQIGRPLFVRHARGVRPTDVADDLAAQLRDTIDHAESALARIKARSAEIAGTIHVNGPIDMLSSLLAPRLRPLVDLGVQVRMHPTDGQDTFVHLIEGLTDFAISVLPPKQDKLSHCLLGDEELLLVISPAIADRLDDDLEISLPNVPMIAYDLQRSLIQNWLDYNGLFLGRSDEVITAPDLRCLRQLAISDFGWTVLPHYLIADDLMQGRLIAAPEPVGNPRIKYYLCWRTSAMRSPRNIRVQQELVAQFSAA